MVQPTQPPAIQENPLAPPGFGPLKFETFDGLNTQPSRPGIEDGQMYVCDGWMPIGKNNARVLPGVGPLIHTEAGQTVIWFDFANIGETPYCIVLHNTGSLHAVNTSTLVATTIAPDGTILNPSVNNIGLSQWGSQYAIIVSPQTNGYFLWDGSVFYQSGGLAPPITITNGGSGYTTAAISFTGGSGSGAAATATIVGGIITKIVITNPGTGYVASDTVTVVITGDGSSAAATVGIMPFGVSGNTVETYTSRVWIGNGANGTFSAPSSVTDFSTASGGGTFTSNDSFLRVGYTAFKQSNGFLYLIADSSINYISGVQTSGSPTPTTTFTNQNADPEIGSPWASTVDVFSRNIVFGNAFGAHVSYGGAVTKISDALDGIYNTVPNFGGFIPSAAKAIIFGRRVWMLLLPIIDQITSQQVNKLMMWDGKKWWTSQQDITLVYIQHQEINSVITAYGTDGVSIYPLFQQPSTGFTKTLQSKLWSQPGGYEFTKASTRLWGLANIYSLDQPELFISVDNENSSSTNPIIFGAFPVTIVNVNGVVVPVINSLGQTVVILGAALGISVSQPTSVAQQGALTGLTVSTTAADVALISLSLQNEVVQYRG